MLESDTLSGVGTIPKLASLSTKFASIRNFTERICSTLEKEDCVLQSMTDASPVRWHLAHTTWFFETFVLHKFVNGYVPFDPRFAYLFNSYYVQAGERFSRPDRGLLSRPTMDDVYSYRKYVNEHMLSLIGTTSDTVAAHQRELNRIVTIGLNHEQQHQELILTDIKHALSLNPLRPALFKAELPMAEKCGEINWIKVPEGIIQIGNKDSHFSFDNENPRHKYYLNAFKIADRPVSNREFLEFVDAGGYRNQLLWLDKAWSVISSENWSRPLYWFQKGDEWFEYTLYGSRPLDMNAPVAHVSFYEADAYARWTGYRLPTEFEWETAAGDMEIGGHFSDEFIFHAVGLKNIVENQIISENHQGRFDLLFGTVWEWTSSQYSAYPGYSPESGALGEYNGKFMCDQFVLRGGSVATPSSHFRLTYRNFFPGYARWQFAGIRVARNKS